MYQLKQILDTTIENVIFKRKGRVFAKIFVHWPIIVTPSLAPISVPTSFNKPDRLLLISVHNPTKAIEIYFMQEIILKRIELLLKSQGIKQEIEKIYVHKYQTEV